jgi:hypothetical protein
MDELFRRPVPLMSLYRAVGVAASVAACVWYYLDYRRDDEQLSHTVRELASANPAAVERALDSLARLLVLQPRSVLTGPSHVYTGGDELVQRGVVEALLRAAAHANVNDELRVRALDTLALLAVQSGEARARVAHSDVSALCLLIDSAQYGGRAELLAGATLLATLRDVDARDALLAQDGVGRAIEAAATQAANVGPVRLLLGTELLQEYAKHRAVSAGVVVPRFLAEERIALDASLKRLITQPPSPRTEQMQKLAQALGVGAFGFVYGRARWFAHAAAAGTGVPLRRVAFEVAKRTRVGIWLGAIMLVDNAFTALLRNSTAVRDEFASDLDRVLSYQPVANAPARLVVPSLAAVTVSTLLVAAIRRQRFMILPLAVALGVSHFDLIEPSAPWKLVQQQLLRRNEQQ